MAHRIFAVDAFTDRPFAGNPAGVCILEAPVGDAWMQSVAAEMNHAETAFLQKTADGYNLRWFTPTVEVELCGHATLASAHVLWTKGFEPDTDPIRFSTKSGILTASFVGARIVLDFPSEPPSPAELPFRLGILGDDILYVGKNRMDWIVQLPTENDVRGLQPDMNEVLRLGERGLIITAKADTSGIDFVSRFFAPQSGVDEDPATGSAHCCLAPFWSERLGLTSMVGYQASPRGGTVGVQMVGNRVHLLGTAVTFLEGEICC